MKDLFIEMSKIVEKKMKHYQTDFYTHDKKTLLSTIPGQSFYWLVRESGTELYKCSSLTMLEHLDREVAKYWLPSAVVVAKITVNRISNDNIYGDIQIIEQSELWKVINDAKSMTETQKINELLEWLDVDTVLWKERVKRIFNAYDFTKLSCYYPLSKLLNVDISREEFIKEVENLQFRHYKAS